MQDPAVVLDVAYAEQKQVLYVATNKDIRTYDMQLGKCLRIYAGIMTDVEEISTFALSSAQDFLIAADTIGRVQWLSVGDGLQARSSNVNDSVILLQINPQHSLLTTIRHNVRVSFIISVADPSRTRRRRAGRPLPQPSQQPLRLRAIFGRGL